MKYAVCTSFNDEGYELYGKKFLESFFKHWPKDVELHVFYEGSRPKESGPVYHNLMEDGDLKKFLFVWGKNPQANGIVEVKNGKAMVNYRFQAVKFAKKVFAVTSRSRPDADWWIWLDADVVTTNNVTTEFLESVCPDGFAVSYLGRLEWPHSECGWVAYSKRYEDGFLKQFREIYTSGQVFFFREWHDSFIFDALRTKFQANGNWFYNLSPEAKGLNDAWNHSPLCKYMKHNKGPIAKREAYEPV